MAEPTEPIPGLNRWHDELRAAGAIVAAAVTPMLAVDELVRAGWRPRWDDGTKPPAGLPAVLSSVDDLPGVCAAAGLAREEPRPGDSGRWAVWTDGVVSVVPAYGMSGLAIVALRGTGIASISPGAPTRVLWAAIQAVRGGERGE